MSNAPVLEGVTIVPAAAKFDRYRWCDYIELRCLTHIDRRFSRDGLVEAIGESKDVSETDDSPVDSEGELPLGDGELTRSAEDEDESFVASCFKHLRWRSHTFGEGWPFTIDEHAQEIRIKPNCDSAHYFYLHLLLSSLLKYCPPTRRKIYTSSFEEISLSVFRCLMPKGAEVHAFGATHSKRYTGHLFERLEKLTADIRGKLLLTKQDFPKNNSGDGGLDLVAWHDLKDERDHIPIAFAQCGCTVDGWPDKMLEASPAKLSKKLVTGHDWATYYFMPLDLTDEREGAMSWQRWSDVNCAIVIDRLRLFRLTDHFDLSNAVLVAKSAIDEALSMKLT